MTELAETLVELLRQQKQQSEAQQAILMGMLEQQKNTLEAHKADVTSLLERGTLGPVSARETRLEKLPPPMLQKLQPSDDVEQFLTVFERVARQQKWPEDTWATQLPALLTGKARAAYVALPWEEATNFECVKAAVLKRYDINTESHRRKFRSDKKREGDTHTEFMARLKDRFSRWVKSQALSVEDLIVLEQFYQALPPDVAIWLRDRKPESLEQAATLADDYFLSRAPAHPKQDTRKSEPSKANTQTTAEKRCYLCQQPGHFASACPSKSSTYVTATPNPSNISATTPPGKSNQHPRNKEIVCYNCHKKGHLSTQCPNNAMFCTAVPPPPHTGIPSTRAGFIEGQPVNKIVLDTGCSQSMVRQELVPEKQLTGEAVTIRCAHGDVVLYPLAEVHISVDNQVSSIKVAVSQTLPVDTLLGTDSPVLSQLLAKTAGCPAPKDALIVMTRSQTHLQQVEETRAQQQESESGVQPHPLTPMDKQRVESPVLVQPDIETDPPFQSLDDELFTSAHPNRPRLSRSEKRKTKATFSQTQRIQDHVLDLNPTKLQSLQKKDNSLSDAWKAASGPPCTAAGPGFFIKDGILMRESCTADGTPFEQVVVPASCRQDIIKIAHEIPMAGHLGRNKTAKRILAHFYWPTLFRDVREFCRSCDRCQKAGGRKCGKVPLIPLPIMSVPFQRIAMDIVGPLPKSNKGNRYILVICDYATRYPEAIPLRSIEAETIAEELVSLFSRVGIPNEILTDQGSNFTSKLLQELYRLLHMRRIQTSPYHLQTDGLVERFNQTLKAMLHKAASAEGKDWDKLIPYLLFAYREVPQDSTGFSPFELLYGRAVRGPLDVIKDSWIASEKSDESIVSYILHIREKLAAMVDIMEVNLDRSQRQQKKWYDKSAHEREFQIWDHVLVLLPTSANKLLAQWQGPYLVKEKVGKVITTMWRCMIDERSSDFSMSTC
jgi:transposase InsO family protein